MKVIRLKVKGQRPCVQNALKESADNLIRQREKALIALMNRVDSIVVVGSRQSRTSEQLFNICIHRGKPCLCVESENELTCGWFFPFHVVGVASGRSIPKTAVNRVCRKLKSLQSYAEFISDPANGFIVKHISRSAA